MTELLLTDGRVALRAPEPEDMDVLFRVENDESLWAVSCNAAPYSKAQLEQYIRESVHDLFAEHQLRFVIECDGAVAGFMDLTDIDAIQAHAQVGVALLPEYRGRGVASAALGLLCRYADRRLRLMQLVSYVPLCNEPSLHLFEKAGFERVGLLSEWMWSGERFEDVILLQKKLQKK